MSFSSRLLKKVTGRNDNPSLPAAPPYQYSPPSNVPYTPTPHFQYSPPPPPPGPQYAQNAQYFPPPPPRRSPHGEHPASTPVSLSAGPPPLPYRQPSPQPVVSSPIIPYVPQQAQVYNQPLQLASPDTVIPHGPQNIQTYSPPPAPTQQSRPTHPHLSPPQTLPPSRSPAPSPRPSPAPRASAPPQMGPYSAPRSQDPPKLRKILSLDGGGVRGLSIIMILKYIMGNLNRARGIPLDPWQEFDMICGTSTGGIIAIMLGRLHMSLKECEEAYVRLSQTIFTPVRNAADPRRMYEFLMANGKFSEDPLRESIQHTIWSKGLAEDALLKDEDPDACRVFVCATRAGNSSPAVFRSYESDRNNHLYDICRIWEAARATSAASTFFEPIKIGNQQYVDGAIKGRNNPIVSANLESKDIWPDEERLLISIGTGIAPNKAFTGNLVALANRLKEIVTDTEQTNEDFEGDHMDMITNDRFFRFNVSQGLGTIGLEEYQAVDQIEAFTDSYLDSNRVVNSVRTCVKTLRLGGQRMGFASAEELEAMMQAVRLSQVFVTQCAKCLQGLCFGENVYTCTLCNVDYCSSCQSSHAVQHASSIIRFVHHPWPPQKGTADLLGACSECSVELKCRIECADCSLCICSECGGIDQRRQRFFKHWEQHPRSKGFIQLLPPSYKIIPTTDHQCECFYSPGYISHCQRCHKAMKIGDTLHLCKTCRREYDVSPELCEQCYIDELQNHVNHEFGRVTITRVTDMPDDKAVQVNNWWRCSFPGCEAVTGPDIDWMHPHPDARLCLGDALLEHCRKNVSATCFKTFSTRSRLREPDNPSTIKCNICQKATAYDLWHHWCPTCDTIQCKTCIDTRRASHYHAMHWTRIVKFNTSNLKFDFNTYRICDRCGTNVMGSLFQGFECASCREYHTCLTCVQKKQLPLHEVCGGQRSAFELRLLR